MSFPCFAQDGAWPAPFRDPGLPNLFSPPHHETSHDHFPRPLLLPLACSSHSPRLQEAKGARRSSFWAHDGKEFWAQCESGDVSRTGGPCSRRVHHAQFELVQSALVYGSKDRAPADHTRAQTPSSTNHFHRSRASWQSWSPS